jgi:MFS family permease
MMLRMAKGASHEPLPEGVARLIVLRTLRSVAQGALGVAFPLYLVALGISTVTIGALFTAAAVASAAMTLAVGLLADRLGRKPFIMAFAVLTAVSGLVFLLSRSLWALAPVVVLAGIGRGGLGIGGGQAGAFAPALQAMMAEKAGDRRRTPIFALASGISAYASAGGAFLSGAADWLARPSAPLLGYQALFALTLASGVAMVLVLAPMREKPPAPRAAGGRAVLSPSSWRAVGKLSIAGGLNGLGMGFVTGFLPIWFHLRYGVGVAAVGTLMAGVGLLAGPAFAIATRVARRWGEIRAITFFRGIAPVLLALIPLQPTFGLAAAAYIAAMAFTMAPMPIRQSFAMGVVDEQERASATGIRATAVRLPSAVSPTLTGYLLDVGDLGLPFWLMAACMAASAALYYVFFQEVDTRRWAAEAVEAPAHGRSPERAD